MVKLTVTRSDINVYQQRWRTGLLICLNEPLRCPVAFCYYMKCCASFKSTCPEQIMMCTHNSGQRTIEIAMVRSHTTVRWGHQSPYLYYSIVTRLDVISCNVIVFWYGDVHRRSFEINFFWVYILELSMMYYCLLGPRYSIKASVVTAVLQICASVVLLIMAFLQRLKTLMLMACWLAISYLCGKKEREKVLNSTGGAGGGICPQNIFLSPVCPL